MAGRFRVGVITSTHGVKGAVKVFPTTDDLKRFELLEKVEFSPTDSEEDIRGSLRIDSVQYLKGMAILHFRDVGTIEIAERLKGGSLWIKDEDAIPLEQDEFYLRDLLDAEVVLEDGTLFGKITDILETGANMVFEIEHSSSRETLLLPVIKDCIVKMDPANKKVVIRLMEGLL